MASFQPLSESTPQVAKKSTGGIGKAYLHEKETETAKEKETVSEIAVSVTSSSITMGAGI